MSDRKFGFDTLCLHAGQIPDADMPAAGPGSQGPFRVTKKLLPQLAELGYKPADKAKARQMVWIALGLMAFAVALVAVMLVNRCPFRTDAGKSVPLHFSSIGL